MTKRITNLRSIFAHSTVRSYKKGHIIFHQGDELTQVGYLVKGFIKLYNITSDGEERIVLLLGPGTPLPVSIAFKKGSRAPYFYEAFTNCKVALTLRENIEKELNASKDAKLLMAERLEDVMVDLSARLAVFENKNAVDKIASLLAYLVKVCGEQITGNVYAIKFKITHQDIANMTGLARETASIQLKSLESKGVLTQKRSFTVIDLSKLEDE